MGLSEPSTSSAPGNLVAGRVLRGSIALSLGVVVNVVGQLATLPVAMKFWGPARYGDWLVLSGAVTFLAFADLGLQTHVVNKMCADHAQGNRAAFLDSLHSALRLQLVLLALVLVVGSGVMLSFPVTQWLNVHSGSPADVQLAVFLLGIELMITIPMGVIGGSYRATGNLVRSALMGASQRTAFFIGSLVAISAGANFVTLAAARVTVAIFFSVLAIWDLRRTQPWWHLLPLRGSLSEGARMLAPGLFFVLLVLSDYLSQQSAVLILQQLSGPEEVTRFVTHRTAVNVARMFSGMLTAATWVEITAMEARLELGALRQAHQTVTRINAWLVGGTIILLIPVAQFLYGAWTLRKLELDVVTLGMLAFQTLLWGMWTTSATVLQATNRQAKMAGILLVNSALVAALSVLLAPRFGAHGCAAACLLADLLVASWLAPLYAARAAKERYKAFLRSVLPFFIRGVALPSIAAYACWRWCPSLPLGALLGTAVGLGASIVFGWKGLEDRERDYIASLALTLRRKVMP